MSARCRYFSLGALMLGFGPLAKFALAQCFDNVGETGLAWRRKLAFLKPEAILNRHPSPAMGLYDSVDDDEEAAWILIGSL
jgi:hypothetical protein